MYGWQESYQERWESSPEGMIRKVSVLRRELSKEEAERLFEVPKPVEQLSMFSIIPASKKRKISNKPIFHSGLSFSFDSLCKAFKGFMDR